AYDATWIAINAMQKANSAKPADFNGALKGTRYDGITGTIAFTNTGDLKNPSSTLYEVKNAAWQPVTTQTAD
ncbi:branched-chain amino acid ABC transporter substrate-binding protein, partial [Paraburkholderia sp. SIMBA_049]